VSTSQRSTNFPSSTRSESIKAPSRKIPQKYKKVGSVIPIVLPVRIESPVNRFLLRTPVLRKLGRQVIRETIVSYDGLRYWVRTSGGDVSIIESSKAPPGEWVKPGDTVIDTGAHIGWFAVTACRAMLGKGKVVAIEPSSENFEMLRKNVKLNGYEAMCTLMQAGAGSSTGKATIYIYRHGASDSFLKKGEEGSPELKGAEEVRLITLDSVIPSADFIKINVEGLEYEVLKGSERLLRESHPRLFIQFHKVATVSKADFLAYLRSFGYEPRYIEAIDMYLTD
jgi:FkbM family methyltransferase